MIRTDDAIDAGGVRFLRDTDEPDRLWFEPGQPDAVRGPNGSPQAQAYDFGGRVILQLGVCLRPTSAELDALRPELAARLGLADPALLKLAPRPARLEPVKLCLAETPPTVLASAMPSSCPPFNTLLSVTLEGDRAARVLAAVGGEHGVLSVRYLLLQDEPGTVRAVCNGDVAVALPELRSRGVDGAVAVRELLDAGRLVVQVKCEPAEAPENVRERVVRLVLDAAARTVESLLTGPTPEQAQVHAEASEQVLLTRQVELRADVAGWAPVGVTPGPGPVEHPRTVTVSLADDLRGPPLETVEVTATSGQRVSLLPSGSGELPDEDGDYLVTATYQTADRPHTAATRPAAGELHLDAPDVGVGRTMVDANARREAGVRKLRLRVQQRRGDGRRGLDSTLWFAATETPWRVQLLLVDPDDSSLEYELVETGPDGGRRVETAAGLVPGLVRLPPPSAGTS